MFDKEYWHLVADKLIRNFVSAKMWIYFITLIGSAYLLMNGHLTGDNFAAVAIAGLTSVCVMEGSLKIAKIREISKQVGDKIEDIKKFM
jgi:hypothetical protein